ncbi:MAG: sulfatase-like hydrolase/transferase [Myxococcota bacterium]
MLCAAMAEPVRRKVRATTTQMLRRTTRALPPLRRAAALFVALAVAKLAVVLLRAGADGVAPPASALVPFVLLWQDALLVLGLLLADFGLASWLGGRPRAATFSGRTFWVLGALVTLWAAFNVPVARYLSTPLTADMLAAVDTKLSDSVLGYLTFGNIVGGLAPLAAFALVARLARPYRLPTALYALGVTAIIGLLASGKTPLLGVHRNAVLALIASAMPEAPLAPASQADLHLEDAGPSLDLRDLAGRAEGKSVIVVALESTGARYLPAWRLPDDEDERDPMPNLGRLMAHGVLFDRIWTTYPESIKGYFAALCSQWPLPRAKARRHAASVHRASCLPRALQGRGYATGLFHSGWFAYLGMADVIADRGFDVMLDAGDIGGEARTSFGTDDRETVRKALAWIDGLPAGKPFFLDYLPIAGHHPYRAPGDAKRPFVEVSEEDAYLNDLAVGDAALGELMAGIADRHLADDVVWIIYGDHGEAFQQHPGNFAHTLFVYEENLHVPLALVLPGMSGAQRRAPQRGTLADLAPTLLALLGMPPDPLMAGRSLLEPRSPPAVAFTDQRSLEVAVGHGDWKAILEDGDRLELYDLGTDPAEQKDKSLDEPERAARYRRFLTAWLADHQRAFGALDRVDGGATGH